MFQGHLIIIFFRKALSVFDGTKRMLSKKYGPKFRQDLESELLSDIEQKRKLNDERRAAKLVQTPLIIIVALFVCWFAIFILGKKMVLYHPLKMLRNAVAVTSGCFCQCFVDALDRRNSSLARRSEQFDSGRISSSADY